MLFKRSRVSKIEYGFGKVSTKSTHPENIFDVSDVISYRSYIVVSYPRESKIRHRLILNDSDHLFSMKRKWFKQSGFTDGTPDTLVGFSIEYRDITLYTPVKRRQRTELFV